MNPAELSPPRLSIVSRLLKILIRHSTRVQMIQGKLIQMLLGNSIEGRQILTQILLRNSIQGRQILTQILLGNQDLGKLPSNQAIQMLLGNLVTIATLNKNLCTVMTPEKLGVQNQDRGNQDSQMTQEMTASLTLPLNPLPSSAQWGMGH
jgi:hypothetical protein